MTRYTHLDSRVSYDANVITPRESVVESAPGSDVATSDASFVDSDAYKSCTAVPRLFTPSIRGASEICDAIAHAQYNTFHLYNSRKMAPAFLAGCSSDIAFGSKREKRLALKLCFSDSSRVDNLIKDFESLRNNAFEGFIRALEEKSPINVAMAAWVLGKASADMILLRKNNLKHGPLKKFSAAGLFTNDGTAVAYAAPSDYMAEISKRSKNTDMTFDTATRVFDVAIKRVLAGFIKKATGDATEIKKKEDLGIYLRQTRMGTEDSAEIEGFACPGILTPRNPDFLAEEQAKRASDPEFVKTVIMFDAEINKIGNRRKRKSSEDLDRSTAKDIIGSSPAINGGLTNQAEWSMHMTQLVAEAFLETMSSLLACSFGVADPLSREGMDTIKGRLLKNTGDLNSKRVEADAASAAIEYFVKIGNFSIPFVASDPNDIVEGRRVSPNTPVIFIVNKTVDSNDASKTNTIFSLRDRLLVKDDLMAKALASEDDGKAATHTSVKAPTVGGSLPVIRGPFSTEPGASTAVRAAKEGISIDWYVNLSNMCSAGKTTAAVASGISRALASVDIKSSSTPPKRPEERKMLESLRRNVDRSKNLLYTMGQNLSSWGHEEHNATINSYWSSVSSARSFAVQEAMNRGNDIGVRYQFDRGCIRDSFVDAEAHMRVSFFDAVDRPGDSILHLGDVVSSLSSNASDASWKRFVDAMDTLPSAARRVFNIKELLNAASGFKSAFGAANRRRKVVLKNVGAAVKLIKGLVEMSLQNAFNVASFEEAGSIADGWAFNNQFEPSRMKAIEDLSGSRNRRDVVTIMLSQECGSIKFADRSRRGSNHKRTDVLVIPLVILEHLVADKVVLDSVASASNRSLASILENFIEILSGNTKVFNDQNKFMTLVRYIWFNMAILSLTDSNIISAINMARRDLGDSIYSDYLAIRSLVNQYGDGASKYSIGKIIEAYGGDGKKSSRVAGRITTDDTLNSVLKKLTAATEAFSGEREADTRGVKAIADEGTVNNTVVRVNVSDVIGAEGQKKLSGFLRMVKSAVETSINLNQALKQASVVNTVDQTQKIIQALNAEGPAKNKPLEDNRVVEINLNPDLKELVEKGIRRLLTRLGNEPVANTSHISSLQDILGQLPENDYELLVAKYFIPEGVTPKAATGVIAALNENYPHSDLLSTAINALPTDFTSDTPPDSVSVKMSDMKNLLKNGLVVSLACLTNPRGLDFNLCGANLLSTILAHFSAEASLALSRLQDTFSPIHPGLLALHDTVKPSKAEFDIMTEDFIKSVIEKIEEDSAPFLPRCDDSRIAKGLADAGVNYNDSVDSGSGSTPSAQPKGLVNPTDLWNKYALAHFDTAIVPQFANTSRLSNTDLVKLSAYRHGMSKLPEGAAPESWRAKLVGTSSVLSVIPGMRNVCTFNSALDTMLANPENSCGLISREITRNSAKLAHDIGSAASLARIDDVLKTGHTIVLPKYFGADRSSDQQLFDVFKRSSFEGCETATSSLGIISERFCANTTAAGSSENDLVSTAIRSLPSFRQDIVDAARSLFEAAAVCNLLSSNADAKVASKTIINIIKTQSNVIGEIGISRIAGLVSSVTTYKQYRNFLAFVDEKRRTLMRRAALNYNSSCGLNAADSMYVTLAAINPSHPGKMEHLPDRFWIEVFEDCEGFVEEDIAPKVFTSKLNSYAAVASKADRTRSQSLKAETETRRRQVASNMGELENFVINAAKIDLKDDKDVALSNLMKAQRLLARMNMAIEARRNDSVVFLSNRGQIPTAANVIDGVFSEMVTGPAGKDSGSLFLASKMLVAKEITKQSPGQEAIEMTLAAAGVDSHAYRLAEIICQRMNPDDISLFMGGAMLQRGLFTTFLLNDILARQISPDLMTNALSADTKKQMVNLVEFCTKIKQALITMRNNKGRSIKRYVDAQKKNKTITEDMRADWAFASSVYSAFKTLRDNTSSETRASNLIHMLGAGAFGGTLAVAIRPKRKSSLNDVLEAGTTLNRSFFSNYCEKTAASKVVRTSNVRMYRALRMRNNQNPGLLACFDSGKLFSNSVEEGIHSTSRFCQDEDYDMFDEDDMMDLSSESSSDSEGMSDRSSSDSEYDESEDDASERKKDALAALDSLAVPLGKLYACGEGYDDDFNSAFDTSLGRLVGRIDSDDDGESDESDEEVLNVRGNRRAHRIVYGAGFLSGGPPPIYDNPYKLGEFLRGKKAKYDLSSSSDYTSSSDSNQITLADRLKRRSKKDQMSFVKRGLRQFVPKDITIDENDEITVVKYMSEDKASGFLTTYGASGPEDRKRLRGENSIQTTAPSKGTRAQRVSFRRNLVKGAAAIVKTLKTNGDTIYSALFAKPTVGAINTSNVAKELLFADKLKAIVAKRNEYIQAASAATPTLFSCEDGGNAPIEYTAAEAGYLTAPLDRLALCLRKKKGTQSRTVNAVLADKSKTHLDWLNTVSTVFARSFNVTTGHALDEVFKVTKVLESMYDSFETVIDSAEGAKENVKSSLLSDIFNTRMVHTNAIMGLFLPTAFLNYQIMGKNQLETNEIEMELLTLVRGINSRQLTTEDLGGSTDILLNRLMSPRVSGPAGSRGGLSLFRMSLTDTVLGKGLPSEGGRVKGAVSLEVRSGGPDGGLTIGDHIFAKRCKHLVEFCKKHDILIGNASGPLYRFATGVKDIKSELSLPFTPHEGEVADDILANRLIASETDEKRGEFMRLSAHGNLYGCSDIISRLARKSIEMRKVVDDIEGKNPSGKSTKERAQAVLDDLRNKCVKALKTSSNRRSIVLANNAFPSFSENVLYKSREFLASVATLTNEVSKRLSLEFNKLSLKSFERILENSAVLANTKSTLRNLENRLQAAVVELGQFKHIRDDGLTTPRRVIDTTAKRLCTLTPKEGETWLEEDLFIVFAVNTELLNLKEAKRNISRALRAVHAQHMTLLNMINTAISTDDSSSSSGSNNAATSTAEKKNLMKLSACGKYVIHPSTGLLVKIEEGDITGSCGDGIESVHRQVALKVLERIDRNRNNLIRNKLYAMRTGRGDLRAIVSLDNEDMVKTDALVKALGTALANSTASTDSITPQQYQQQQQQSTVNSMFNGSVLPIRKAMSYIPVALENKHFPSPSCADAGSAPSSTVSLLSDGNQDTTYRFMDQQEAHDLAVILNIRSKHMGDYNQASLVALFNRSHRARANISVDEKASAAPSQQLFENISQTTAALTTPPSALNKGGGSGKSKRVSDYVSKIASTLTDTPEYSEMTKIYDDMAAALSVSSSVVARQFITNPSQEGHYPKTDYDTIKVLSEMIQLKTTAIERYVKLLSGLSSYSNDPSMASSLRLSSSPIVSTIETGAIDSSVIRNISPDTESSSSSTVDVMGKIEAAFQGGNPREVITRETDIRRTLLMHYDPFLNKIQNTLKMITDYFANIEKIREVVKEEVKRVSADQIRKVEKSLKASEQDAVPVYERGVDMHKEEVNAINTEIGVLRTKIVEIESTHDEYVATLESLTNKFSTGTNEVPVDDLMSISDSSQRQSRMIEDLSDFAKKHAGVVYDPEVEEASKTENMKTIKNDIARGQDGVRVSYANVLAKFPGALKDEMKSVEDIKIFMSNLRLVTTALGDYAFVLRSRIRLLEDRASTSSADAASIEERIGSSKVLLQNQLVEQRVAIERCVGLSASAINHTLVGEVVQVETLNFIDIQVERLLTNAKRGDTPATVNETASPREEGSTIFNTTSSAETVDRLAADIEGSSFACQLKPLHDVIDRMMDMYRRKGTSIVSSKVDLQLASIFDMTTAVLGKNNRPEQKPSDIVPGLCRLCAMMITNLHEETHTSDHAFEFDTLRSTETLRRMLSAVISKDSGKANVRYDTLAMLESHNGYVKDLKFKKKQNVACLTPINTLLGAYDDMTVQPGTVLLPSSELFACDGLDHDKFRSIIHRSSDPSLADSSKSAGSIVETYASSDPNAEMLFFALKDERRFFNSIPDCIIENMSESANSVYNTYCSQSAVREDPRTGIPVFVGRLNRPSTTTTAKSAKSAKSSPGNGGVPTHCTGTVNMSARYMVAPGSTLNAKKEEMMRLSRASDVNNVFYHDLDVNVSGANNAWRIGEIVKAACGGNDMLMEKARKMLLLGSVTTLAQQKASSRVNDPTTLLQTNSVVEQYVAGETLSAEDLIVKMSYQQRFFPEICNHASHFIGGTAAANSGGVCPGDLLGDYKRFKTALNRHDNSCGVFLNSMSGVPTSSTQQGILDTVVQSQPIREKNTLAVGAMIDSTVDMVSAVSSGAWKNANLFMPHTALTGKPITRERAEDLKRTLAGVLSNAHKLDRMGGVGGVTSLSAVFGGGRGNVGFASTASAIAEGNSESERLFNMILGNAASSSPSSLSTKEDIANNRSLVSSILDISDKEMTDMVRSIEESIDKSRLEKAISEIKRNVLITSSSPITSSRASPALSAVLKASDIRQGRLSSSVMESGEDAVRAIESFKTSPLLVRHTALFHPFSPLTLSSQTRDMLARRTKSTTTANNLLSESMPILSDVFLCNTRDTPAERAIDRMLLAAYITKQAKHFDDVCSSVPVALTSVTHNMLSAIDHKSSRLISNLKLHMNDTTSVLMNIERFEKFSGRYGDEYAMSHRQNCNCPFELHHDFRPSADESLVRSFAYARPEVTIDEIRDTPYLCHRTLSNKHFIMDATKVDPRVSGAALYRKVSAWADMHNNVSYTGTFEPSRMALANSNFSTAGVNLDVIVRPNNASGVLGVLSCHRKHLCATDLKVSIASSMPSVFSHYNEGKPAAELIQNALPHNKYIQKSRLNASTIIFANVLDKLIKDLGMDISRELSYKLLNGEHSVPETVLEETNTIMNKLMSSVSASGTKLPSSKEASSSEAESIAEAAMLTGDIASNYARIALKEAVSEELRGSAENVPFSSAADGSMAFDFLMSKDTGSGVVDPNGDASSPDRSLIAVLFEAIASKIGDKDFSRILDGIDAKINDFNTTDALSNMSSEAKDKWLKGRQELRRLLSFLRILRDNITPSLTTGELGEDVKLYISLISAKSRLENVLRYGLSNSSSVDLSHLKPLNPTAVSKNIEDTFTYRNVPPVFIMALPDNFSALFQQEQRDPEYIIDSRRSITSFLNHPNTKSMANAARASAGPGGGSSMGIYPSALLLQESSVVTAEPVVDAKTSPPTMYETSVTKSPLMIVDPFKPSAGLEGLPASAFDIINTDNPCSYLQVSMPTQFSGLVTNTGVTPSEGPTATFEFKRRDGSVVNYRKLTPAVLCSDASFNLMDEFSRADTTLNDMEIRFGFMPEILEAIAKFKGLEVSDVIKSMNAKTTSNGNGANTSVDRATGDVITVKNGVAFPSHAVESTSSTSNEWGVNGIMQGRSLPSFLINNPSGAAAVNGVPVTREGELLAALKRGRAAGKGDVSEEEFGKGVLSEGALRAVGDKTLSSDLKPLKEGWDRLVKLQKVFTTAANNLRESVENNALKDAEVAKNLAQSIVNNFKILKECKNFIRDMTSRIVASSDLVTGGYGGDPSMALVAPYRSENMGIIGAVSGGINTGIGGLMASKSRGIEALRTTMEEQITLSSKRGREMPEHSGIRYDDGEELVSDADSLFRGVVDKSPASSSLLHKVVENLVQGLETRDRLRQRAFEDVKPSMDSEENKRHAITKLLSENHDLLAAVANTMYFGSDQDGSVPNPRRVIDIIDETKYQQRAKYDAANKDGLNALFNTR